MNALGLDLYWVMHAPLIFQCVVVVARLGIADLLKDKPQTADGLAAAVEADATKLLRILRVLASLGFLRRDGQGRFHLTAKLEPLCSDAPLCLRHWLLLLRDMAWPACDKLLESVQTGKLPIELAHGKECWQFFEEDEEMRRLFDLGMGAWTQIHAPAVVAACDLSQTRELVDVGGGRGTLMVALLQANPHLRGVVFDRPEAVEVGRQYIAAAGLSERCEMVGGDFLSKVPASEAYIIKHALHDWTNEFAVQVLRTIRASIKPGGRLLIVDAVMDEAPHAAAMVSLLDLSQMLCTTGHVRTRTEFREMLTAAGFELRQIVPSTLDDVAILECAPVRQSSGLTRTKQAMQGDGVETSPPASFTSTSPADMPLPLLVETGK